jgi:hypothetical protein
MQEQRSISPADHEGGAATSTEAIALFHEARSLQSAVDALLTHGFDHSALSVLADEHTIASKLGHGYDSTAELEDDPDVPRVDYVPNETIGNAEGGIIAAAAYFPAVIGGLVVAASGGTLVGVAAAAAVAGGTGAGIGAVLARRVGRGHTRHLDEHIGHGGLILWVRTPDAEHEQAALEILAERGGWNVHLHPMPPTKTIASIPTRRPLLSFGPAA